MSANSSHTTSVYPQGFNLSLLDLLLNSSAGGNVPVVLLPLLQGSQANAHAMSVNLSSLATAGSVGHRRSSFSRSHHKRAKRTAGRACGQCGTTATVQWRKGPDGSTSLCNACGQRYHRRQAAAERQKAGRQRDQHKHRMVPLNLRHHQHHFQASVVPHSHASTTTMRLPSANRHERGIVVDTSSITPRGVKYEPDSPNSLPGDYASAPTSPTAGSSPKRTAQEETIKRSTIYSLLN